MNIPTVESAVDVGGTDAGAVHGSGENQLLHVTVANPVYQVSTRDGTGTIQGSKVASDPLPTMTNYAFDTTPWQGALLQISLALGVDSGNQYFVGTMFRVNVTFSGIRLFSPPGPAETSLYDEQIKIHKTGLQNMVNTWNDLPEHCPTYGNYYYREEDKTDGSAYDEKLEKARQTLLKARKHYKQMQQQKAVSKGITKPKHKRIKSLQQNEWETILTENGEIKKKAFNVEQVDLTKKEFLTDQESEKVLQQFRNQLAEEPFYQNQMEDPEIQKIADGLYSEDPSDQTENRFPEDLMYDEQEELEKLHKHLSDNSKAKKKLDLTFLN